jgi:serine/threonine-protein kinase
MLGRGAMGVVYEGYDPLIKRSVALKTIRSDQLQGEGSEGVLARFQREAQAVGRLNHPSIVTIYDFAEDAGTWYIAMELVKGRELKEIFQAGERFKLPDVVRIMAQILEALDYSHRQGVVHRDIKPANIFVLPDGTAKVADFGIAYVESSNLTQVGTTIGTPSYMSPEQIMGLPVDGRSDLFSAGVILYQFLTGERPFSGSSNTTMQKVLKEDPLPPSELNLQVPAPMDAVVRKALAKRADERFQSAREFADALRASASLTDAEATMVNERDRPAPAGARDAAIAAASAASSPAARASVPAASVPTGATVSNAALPPPTPAAQPSGMAAAPRPPRTAAVAASVIALAIALGAGAWYLSQRMPGDGSRLAQATSQPGAPGAAPTGPATPSTGAPPAATAMPSVPVATGPGAVPASTPSTKPEPGTVVVSAIGLVDPSNPRYQSDKTLLQGDLRADSKAQLVEKALGLLIDRKSVASNYGVLQDRLLSKSGSYIDAVMQESEPQVGKDGLMSMTTQAVVNVRALQKTLNQMSRDERIELIRAKGDPRIGLRIAVRDADRADAPAQPSPVAENILKARIRSFGFRTWSADEPMGGAGGPDFAVEGEAKNRKLSMRLEASGLVVSKYALTSWTVKCIDRNTGEEVYFNTQLPKGVGSWATEEEALKAIGTRVADEFSRDFFLQHVNATGQKIALLLSGLPDAASERLVLHELVGLPGVISARARAPAGSHLYDLLLAGVGPPGDVVAADVVPLLNAKLGQACFALGAIAGEQVTLTFDPRCGEVSVLARLETNPPAGLYGAPSARQKAIVANPDTRRKLMI